MSTLAGLFGSGAGLVVIGIAVLAGAFIVPHCPKVARGLLDRLVIILMYAGGSAIAVTTLGTWSAWLVTHIADLLGGLDAAIPRAALILVSLFLILAVAVSLIWAPNAATGLLAAVLPLILGLVAGGFIHEIYTATVIPGQTLATAVSTWIGG